MAHCSMFYYYTKWNIIENVWFVHLIHKYLLDFILFLPKFKSHFYQLTIQGIQIKSFKELRVLLFCLFSIHLSLSVWISLPRKRKEKKLIRCVLSLIESNILSDFWIMCEHVQHGKKQNFKRVFSHFYYSWCDKCTHMSNYSNSMYVFLAKPSHTHFGKHFLTFLQFFHFQLSVKKHFKRGLCQLFSSLVIYTKISNDYYLTLEWFLGLIMPKNVTNMWCW